MEGSTRPASGSRKEPLTITLDIHEWQWIGWNLISPFLNNQIISGRRRPVQCLRSRLHRARDCHQNSRVLLWIRWFRRRRHRSYLRHLGSFALASWQLFKTLSITTYIGQVVEEGGYYCYLEGTCLFHLGGNYILLEDFVDLRALPPTAYDTVRWSCIFAALLNITNGQASIKLWRVPLLKLETEYSNQSIVVISTLATNSVWPDFNDFLKEWKAWGW